jgi:hypothetical protein
VFAEPRRAFATTALGSTVPRKRNTLPGIRGTGTVRVQVAGTVAAELQALQERRPAVIDMTAARETTQSEISPSTKAVGFWSAVLATVFSITYDVGQLAEWLGWLGSGGGAENASTPLGLAILLTPSLLLGASFLSLMVAVHQLAPRERGVWSHCAVSFATVYTALISINYFVQLTWVAPRLASGQTEGIEAFLFTPFDSFLYAVDILGYTFMSLATLFAANVFMGKGLERVVRAFLFANGLLIPFIALQMYLHGLIWIAALWAVTFPGSTGSLAILFHRARTTPALASAPHGAGVPDAARPTATASG